MDFADLKDLLVVGGESGHQSRIIHGDHEAGKPYATTR
jgi:hypothetical protein